ncbi:MAG TPA: hypothetical protein VE971_06280, partial [Candidatus Eisenbacteria bacterium]|nr:hypothetical protein [Candidatus Eisenbacteria bacterium]
MALPSENATSLDDKEIGKSDILDLLNDETTETIDIGDKETTGKTAKETEETDKPGEEIKLEGLEDTEEEPKINE